MNIQDFAAIFQGTSSLVTVALFVISIFLTIKQKRQKTQHDAEAESESVKCLLRSEIVRIYYANRERKSLHSFEYENVAMLYSAYKAMGGNSFVDRIWEEIGSWDIVP